IGVLQLRPAPLLRLVKGQSRVVEPTLIIPVNVADLVSHPGEGGNVVGQRAEARFALTLSALCMHPRRRVDDDGEHAKRLVVLVTNWTEVEIGPDVLGDAMTLQAEVLVAERHRFASKSGVEDAAIE